ncbi:hypothetical protein V2W45_1327686 [Cenococcum geophilum]
MENNKDKGPKRKLRALRYKRKATPSKVKDDEDVGFNTGVAPVIAIWKTRSRIVGKKPIKAAGPKQNTGPAASATIAVFSSKNLRKRAKVDLNINRMTAPNNELLLEGFLDKSILVFL